MPNRILRDWTFSEKIDMLSFEAEVVFTRLLMKADDYGLFHANPKIVKSAIFPLKDDLPVSVIEKALKECVKSGLITIYLNNGKSYLSIVEFGQRLRAMRSKFPHPTDKETIIKENANPQSSDSHLTDTPPPETDEKQTRDERRESETVEVVDLIFPFTSENFMSVWGVLIKEKKWKRKSKSSLQAALKKIAEFSKSEEEAIKIMENTIAGEWQGVFPLKNNENGKSANFKTERQHRNDEVANLKEGSIAFLKRDRSKDPE